MINYQEILKVSNNPSELRAIWEKFQHARIYGGVTNISNSDLNNLHNVLDLIASLLAIFPEGETTRYWASIKRSEIYSILNTRQIEQKVI